MVKSADTADLKSADPNRSWGFKSPSGHQQPIVGQFISGYFHSATSGHLDNQSNRGASGTGVVVESGLFWTLSFCVAVTKFSELLPAASKINLDLVARGSAPKAILKGAWYTNRSPQALPRP